MWVKGNFWAGNSTTPFDNTLNITITGSSSSTYTFGGQSGSKLIVVTGSMSLYSNSPYAFSTLGGKVTANASTAISLDRSPYNNATLNWAAND